MTTDFLPDSDAALLQWLTTFLSVANANLTTLGLVASDLTFLTADNANLTNQLTTVDTNKKALKSSVATKNTTHKRIANNVRILVRKIQGNSGVNAPLKDALGINPRNNKPSPLTPVAPANLTASGTDNGDNLLQWKRNGNHPTTVFLVEAQIGNGPFVQVGAPTATKFTHTGQTPGTEITYRIRARRRTLISSPSNTATLYKTGAATAAQTPVLELKKAA